MGQRFGQRLWFFINAMISTVLMGIVFYGIFTPIGLFLRLFNKPTIPLHFDSKLESYWQVRQPLKSDAKTIRKLF